MNPIEDLISNNRNNECNKYIILLFNYVQNYSGDTLKQDFNKYLLSIQRKNKIIVKKRELICEYRKMITNNSIESNDLFFRVRIRYL